MKLIKPIDSYPLITLSVPESYCYEKEVREVEQQRNAFLRILIGHFKGIERRQLAFKIVYETELNMIESATGKSWQEIKMED